MRSVNPGRIFLHVIINDSLQQCQCKTRKETLFLVENLLIITLIFVLRNMPLALHSPFLSSVCPCLVQRVCLCAAHHTYSDYSLHPHLSPQLLPSVFSHFVLPCIHFSNLVTCSDAVCLHTNVVRELTNTRFLSSHVHTHTSTQRHKSRLF